MSNIQNDIFYESLAEAEVNKSNWESLDNILFNADRRNSFGNDKILELITLKEANETAYQAGEISHADYQRNRIAIEKLPF